MRMEENKTNRDIIIHKICGIKINFGGCLDAEIKLPVLIKEFQNPKNNMFYYTSCCLYTTV